MAEGLRCVHGYRASKSPVIAALLTREEGLMKRLDSRVMVKNPWPKTQAEFFSDPAMG
jgi:hypothetical protein